MVNKKLTNKVMRSLAPKAKVATFGNEPLIIPNHSGDNSAGDILKTPVNDTDIPNKKYVDDAVESTGITAANNLVGQWLLQDDYKDMSGVAPDGSAYGSLAFQDGSTYFYGIEDGINVPIWDELPAGNSGRTINFWFKPTRFSSNDAIIRYGKESPGNGVAIFCQSSSQISVAFYAYRCIFALPFTMSTYKWYHFTLTIPDGIQTTGITEGYEGYINGQKCTKSSTQTAIPFDTILDTPYFSIGYYNINPTAEFRGWLSDVRVYNRELKEHEVRRIILENNKLYQNTNQIKSNIFTEQYGSDGIDEVINFRDVNGVYHLLYFECGLLTSYSSY